MRKAKQLAKFSKAICGKALPARILAIAVRRAMRHSQGDGFDKLFEEPGAGPGLALEWADGHKEDVLRELVDMGALQYVGMTWNADKKA